MPIINLQAPDSAMLALNQYACLFKTHIRPPSDFWGIIGKLQSAYFLILSQGARARESEFLYSIH